MMVCHRNTEGRQHAWAQLDSNYMVGGGEKDCHNFTDIKQLLNMDELHVFLLEYEKCYQLACLKKLYIFKNLQTL